MPLLSLAMDDEGNPCGDDGVDKRAARMMDDLQPGVRRILWTGGFDSTALVVMALQAGDVVVPHYVRLPDCQKQRREMAVRTRVRAALPADFAARLAPEHVIAYSAIEAKVIERYQRLFEERMASQLSPATAAAIASDTTKLPRAEQLALAGILTAAAQAAFEVLSPQVAFLAVVGELIPNLETGYLGAAPSALLDPQQHRELTARLRHPLVGVTKAELLARAERGGFRHLLELTWSCQGEDYLAFLGPCGSCEPCRARILPQIPLAW